MAVLKADAVSAALEQTSGNTAAAARLLGVSRGAVWKFIQSRPKLQEAVHDLRESMKDNAESGLHRAVLAGEAWAICFYLKTQAKDRGYVERSEVDMSAEVRQRVVEEVVDAPSDPGKADQAP